MKDRMSTGFQDELIIGMTLLFGWIPSLPLVFFCVLGLLSGVINLFTPKSYISLFILPLSIGGILGFIALTSLSWGIKLNFHRRLRFLSYGVASMGGIWLLDYLQASRFPDLNINWFTAYFLMCPIMVGVFHLGLHGYYQLGLNSK